MTCHMHLSTFNNNNSPHKLSFQNAMQAGDQKLRYDLVWPNYDIILVPWYNYITYSIMSLLFYWDSPARRAGTNTDNFIYLFVKAQDKCWRSVGHQVLQPAKVIEFMTISLGHQVLQPAKDIELRTMHLKNCRQEKKSTMHQDSLKPAAIWFMLNCLQESARRSGYFLPAFFMNLYPQEP